MDDLISRKMAIKYYQVCCRRTSCAECPLHIKVTNSLTDCELELFLHNLPSAERRGRWDEGVRCSECGWVNESERGFIYLATRFNYCPNCGSFNGKDNLNEKL